MKKYLLLIYVLLGTLSVFSQDALRVSVPSEKMKLEVINTIILPQNYSDTISYPVLYLLHGHGGNNDTWLDVKTTLFDESTNYQMIIVCPDGKNSWYWDSPINEESQYETFVSQELVAYVDKHYKTIQSPQGRAITGLSMGGHGALWLAINHPDVFGACGSMSGGVDIRPFPNNWNMKDGLGKMNENYLRWDAHTVINQLHKIEPNTLDIIIDCGYFYFTKIKTPDLFV